MTLYNFEFLLAEFFIIFTEIKQLVRHRISLKKKLRNIGKYISLIKNGSLIPEISNIKLRYDYNINLINVFENVQKSIKDKSEDELDEQIVKLNSLYIINCYH